MILAQILVIHEPFWNDSGVNLSDLQTILKWFWDKCQWFVNHSEIILGWILANVSDLQTILKWFWGESQCFMNHSERILGQISTNLHDLQTILKWFWGKSWWFTNQSEMICQVNFSDSDTVICKPFWNDSGVNLSESWWFTNHSEMILCESWWFVNHPKMILEWISVICEPF